MTKRRATTATANNQLLSDMQLQIASQRNEIERLSDEVNWCYVRLCKLMHEASLIQRDNAGLKPEDVARVEAWAAARVGEG
jgi:hypothetical protein